MEFSWKGFWKGVFYSLLTIIFIFSLFMIFFERTSYYKEIIYPSYLSVVSVCFPHGEDYVQSRGYITGGQFDVANNSIAIFIDDAGGKINRHEECHRSQLFENRSYGCSNMIFMFFNEWECYIAEKI